jgi:hypothetical protein
MSVADQFLGQAGVAVAVLPRYGLSFSLGVRAEGVPTRDVFGDSNGFRRPGIAVSIEPGIQWAAGRNAFSVSVPVAVYRDRFKNVPDEKNDRHGDAAFADYMVLFGYTHRFGSPRAPQVPAPPPPATLP